MENYCSSQRASTAAWHDFFLGCSPTTHTSLCVFSRVCVSIFHRPILAIPLKTSFPWKDWARTSAGEKSVAPVRIYVSRPNVLHARTRLPSFNPHLPSSEPISLLNHPLLLLDHSHPFSLEPGIFRQPLPSFDATTGKLDLGDVLRQARRLCWSCNFKPVLLQRRCWTRCPAVWLYATAYCCNNADHQAEKLYAGVCTRARSVVFTLSWSLCNIISGPGPVLSIKPIYWYTPVYRGF